MENPQPISLPGNPEISPDGNRVRVGPPQAGTARKPAATSRKMLFISISSETVHMRSLLRTMEAVAIPPLAVRPIFVVNLEVVSQPVKLTIRSPVALDSAAMLPAMVKGSALTMEGVQAVPPVWVRVTKF